MPISGHANNQSSICVFKTRMTMYLFYIIMHSNRKMLVETDEWKISTLSHMIENIYLLAKYKVLVK